MTEPHHKRGPIRFGFGFWRWFKRRFRLRAINWTFVGRTRLCLEILAILAGGTWGIYVFFIAEHRTFQEGGALASTIEWRKTPDGDCSGSNRS